VRWQNVGLTVLAVVAAGLTFLAFRAVTVPYQDGAPAQPVSSTTADGTTTGVDGGAAATAGALGGEVADESPSPVSGIESARALLDREERLVVAALGDSTGNETWEWVYGWGRLLAQVRPVTVISWNEWTQDGYIEPRVLSDSGSGPGGPVVIYGGHQTGARVDYVVEHLEQLLPEPPDLVILNFGHNNTVEDVGDQLADALAAVRAVAGPDLSVVVTLQQPQRDDANAEVRDAVRTFAEKQGLGVIDVATAFEDTGEADALLADDVHPDEAGAAVWAQAVARTLRAP
jgi:hypothetical protein